MKRRQTLPTTDEPQEWHCPALGRIIDHGLGWECCFADQGGPTDTAAWLKDWISISERFRSLEEFHQVCADCKHCQWVKCPNAQQEEKPDR